MMVLKAKEVLKTLDWNGVDANDLLEIQSILQKGFEKKYGRKFNLIRESTGSPESLLKVRFEDRGHVLQVSEDFDQRFYKIETGEL